MISIIFALGCRIARAEVDSGQIMTTVIFDMVLIALLIMALLSMVHP